MKRITWNKSTLKAEDLDFSFCKDWDQSGIRWVWEHEAARELGVESNRFRDCPGKMKDAAKEKADPKYNPVRDAAFARVISDFAPWPTGAKDIQGASDLSDDERASLLEESRIRQSAESCVHLLEIDYSATNESLVENFKQWIETQREELGIPNQGRGRRANWTKDVRLWLDDLAMYRLKAAGIGWVEARRDFAFEVMERSPIRNPTKAFKDAMRYTESRLKDFAHILPNMAD